MKKIALLFCVLSVTLSCSDTNDEPFFEEVIEESEAGIKGDFVSGAHTTSGSILVNEQKTLLSFVNFKTDSGPKLLVYLTTAVGSNDYISLGDLKGTSGNFTYNIPENTDLSKYKIVDIWCVDFSVSFGHAELK